MVAVEAAELPGELQVKAVMGDTGSSMHRISRRCCSTCSRAFSMRLIRLRAVTSQAKANFSLPHTASLESRRISEYQVLLPASLRNTVTTQSQHSHSRVTTQSLNPYCKNISDRHLVLVSWLQDLGTCMHRQAQECMLQTDLCRAPNAKLVVTMPCGPCETGKHTDLSECLSGCPPEGSLLCLETCCSQSPERGCQPVS